MLQNRIFFFKLKVRFTTCILMSFVLVLYLKSYFKKTTFGGIAPRERGDKFDFYDSLQSSFETIRRTAYQHQVGSFYSKVLTLVKNYFGRFSTDY